MLVSLFEVEHACLKVKREAWDLSQYNFFARSRIKDHLRTYALQISSNLETNELQEVVEEMNNTVYKIYAKMIDDFVYLAAIVEFYPPDLIDTVLDLCPKNDLDFLLKEYSDYKKHDHLELISREVEETKVVLTRTLDAVVNRGESLSGLSENAERLEQKSRLLFQKAKKQNKLCC